VSGGSPAEQESPAVAWLTLDERDSDVDRFASYLAAAVSSAGLSLSEIQPGAGR
jgi:ATP/maltotriose-dependent transcriptional regulator MalT